MSNKNKSAEPKEKGKLSLADIGGKLKGFGRKIIKGLGTAGAFLLAVVLVCRDKIKALYAKLPDKLKIFGKLKTLRIKKARTNEKVTNENKKGFFSGLSDKDYARLWAICGGFCVLLFAVVIFVLSIGKPNIQRPAQITSAENGSANKVTISFGGSVVLQNSLLEACKTEVGDYEIYDGLKYLGKCFNSDINICSVIGTVNAEGAETSGFPKTNYPINLVRALKSIHINAIADASDHSFDAGLAGVESTIAACEEQQILSLGLFKDGNDYINPKIIEKNGVRVGFVNASGFTDDDFLTLPETERENRIKHFNSTSAPNAVRTLMQEIDVLKNSDVDAIVAILRWGKEATNFPEGYTREIADELAKNGVDIIVGYGSHYLQKITFKEFVREDGTKKSSLIMYDLGNLYSDNSAVPGRSYIPQDNLIATVEITKSENGKASISSATYTPLYVSQKQDNDISDRAEFVNIPSGKFGSMDERPDLFSSNDQWEWCKNSFERIQARMAEWVGQKMMLSTIPEDEENISSANEIQNAV